MKKLFVLTALYVSAITPLLKAQPASAPIAIKSNAATYLYGTKTSKNEGSVTKQNGDFMRFTGPAKLQWIVMVPEDGAYEVNGYYGAKASSENNQLSVSSENSVVGSVIQATQGVWGPGSYEVVPIKGRLQLRAGKQLISLTISENAKGDPVMDLRCLELIPIAAKSVVEADRAEAVHSRANSDWLPKAGYGLMFHWTSLNVGEDGSHKSFSQAVDDFDIKAFAEMVESTGAGYVLFTVGHAEAYCPAPLASWEKYYPGHTTKRDLIAEMADALNAKGIKLMCYFPIHVVGNLEKSSEQDFIKISNEVVTEFGNRYGKKIAGYWFDGWYQCAEAFPNVSFKDFFKSCKAGNPDRIIALNTWIYPAVTEWQEYWAGETASPVDPPVSGTVTRGPGKGLRYQSLIIMEPYWVQDKAAIPDPRFTADELAKYIKECTSQGGAVTINLGIYQDGKVGKKALQTMQDLRKKMRE